MRFTITPSITALRTSSQFSSARRNSYGGIPSALRTSGKAGKTSTVSGQYLSKSDVRNAVNDILKDDSSWTSKDSWKDSYLDQVKKQAEKDYAAGVYKGDDYQTLAKDTTSKYLSSATAIAQKQFSRESDAAYTAAWNAAKEAAASKTESSESSKFDQRV